MNNPFKYSLDNKRYHTYNYYLKSRFNTKVAKVIIDAGFTCPNRDGKKGYGGCIFCSGKGSGDSNIATGESVLRQYEKNKKVMLRKWPSTLFIPYFQAFSNTYGPVHKIKEMLEVFIDMDEVCEIAIATRPDCLDDEIIELLVKINKIKPISIELGLQSSNDETALKINRGHTFQEFKDALEKLNKHNFFVCVHVLNGLPYEDKDTMLQTIKDINHLPFNAIKIHMLHVIKNSNLGLIYQNNPFPLLSREEYIDLVIEQLELLPPEIVVERLTGDPISNELLAPEWVLNKRTLLNDIDKKMQQLNTWQGHNFK